MAAPKRLFDPGSQYELLLGWLIHAHKGRDRHDLAARHYERGRYALGIPTLVVSTIVARRSSRTCPPRLSRPCPYGSVC